MDILWRIRLFQLSQSIISAKLFDSADKVFHSDFDREERVKTEDWKCNLHRLVTLEIFYYFVSQQIKYTRISVTF